MINAQQLVEEIRRELDPVEQELRRHPYLTALEAGRVRREDLALSFAETPFGSFRERPCACEKPADAGKPVRQRGCRHPLPGRVSTGSVPVG